MGKKPTKPFGNLKPGFGGKPNDIPGKNQGVPMAKKKGGD